MSVVVRDKDDGQIYVFCKGADSVIFERLGKSGREFEEATKLHLGSYGDAGLRMLALAYRKIDEAPYNEWNDVFLKAKTMIGPERDAKLDEASELIERELVLEKRDALEAEAKLLIAQQAFMDKATKFNQREGRASMVPTPPVTASTMKPIAFVGGSCAACGKALSANHMARVFVLTCEHKYHPFCFAVLSATSTECSHPNCKEKIPEIGKCWALGTAYTELEETKDGSCCPDEDHSDLFGSFQMKDTASDDIANVLQDMAKVTTENSPIHVLEEPSGQMDNASTLVDDKDKDSLMEGRTMKRTPVHEGEDHEKNTTLDPVSKVSSDSAEGDHGKDKIVDPASKLSVDNPKESEATDDMDDPEFGKTLRFMAAEMKKKRKRELEEGPANPKRSTKPAQPKVGACKKL